ncbi:pentapeptide repeat-containing protein [Bradyrhizobium diazoefficiens]|uniref:pentapeptide repeat-containing protein n=1 Tax=Bradyrhizobium diazoefficiens TaxID=1355477 RepID=UPI00272BEF48|nr:pentapeptide repeat-containing protein [Bradyrhizobium diazoefficiens]WLA62015.1 pentapeptide repeat-containing protein [Bradyrhizobium diazoefficiens]
MSHEERLIKAIIDREPCDFSSASADDSLENSSTWGPERTISAHLLRRIMLEDVDANSSSAQSLVIIGACIAGSLDFDANSFARSFYFEKCVFLDTVNFSDAQLQTISFEDCLINEEFDFARARVARSINFDGELAPVVWTAPRWI